MNNRRLFFPFVGLGVAIIVVAITLSLPFETDVPSLDPLSLDFDYSMNLQLSESLKNDNISMSSPILFEKAFAIQKSCTFFDDPEKQSQIKYCTSTELLDENGHFLGNIHMVGTPENPKLVMTILEASFDEIQMVSDVFDTVIDNTVCECWEEFSPDGFSSTYDWVIALKDFHQQATSQTTTKSAVLTLNDLKLQSKVTSIEGAYVWKLFVAK